jgi:hypothetical protein
MLSPDAVSLEELRARAWEVVAPQYQVRLTELIEVFAQAHSKGLSSGDLAEVAAAATAGCVETLLLESDRQLPSRLDPTTGRIELSELSDPDVDNLFDDMGELVANKGGHVWMIPAEHMPSKIGVAAIYRY